MIYNSSFLLGKNTGLMYVPENYPKNIGRMLNESRTFYEIETTSI